MRKFEKGLFFYSIATVSAIFISAGVFNPGLGSLISNILLLPILGYFWLRLTDPEHSSLNIWSLKVLVSIVIITALGIYASLLFNNPQINPSKNTKTASEYDEIIAGLNSQLAQLEEEKSENTKLAEELDQTQEELTQLKANDNTVLSANDSSLADLLSDIAKKDATSGSLTVKASHQDGIDGLTQPSFTSNSNGHLEYGKSYLYSEVSGNWYKVDLPENKFGWVHEKDVDVQP